MSEGKRWTIWNDGTSFDSYVEGPATDGRVEVAPADDVDWLREAIRTFMGSRTYGPSERARLFDALHSTEDQK